MNLILTRRPAPRTIAVRRLCLSAKREAMLAAIRVIDIAVDRIEGQSKLNQHKVDEDHVAVADRLARSGTTAGRDLAGRMRALRPHLRYNAPEDLP